MIEFAKNNFNLKEELPVYNSVLQFIEKDIHEIEILVGEVIQGNKDTTDLSLDIQERMNVFTSLTFTKK
ncbi:MAG: hypothetical protein IKI20_10150 [Lachnospiraceae bacterium]|nr:hypothetical protein [Lachnospiraceae bacterium]